MLNCLPYLESIFHSPLLRHMKTGDNLIGALTEKQKEQFEAYMSVSAWLAADKRVLDLLQKALRNRSEALVFIPDQIHLHFKPRIQRAENQTAFG